jgi:hypothetical protein
MAFIMAFKLIRHRSILPLHTMKAQSGRLNLGTMATMVATHRSNILCQTIHLVDNRYQPLLKLKPEDGRTMHLSIHGLHFNLSQHITMVNFHGFPDSFPQNNLQLLTQER